MKTLIINTSDLGYSTTSHKVETNASIEQLKEIDKKYGMEYRHQSTTIKQMEEGAAKEGFSFNWEIVPTQRENDYFCRFGNY